MDNIGLQLDPYIFLLL